MKKRKYDLIEDISFDMPYMKLPEDDPIVPDEAIISRIEQIDDLEQRDKYGRTLLLYAVINERKNFLVQLQF